MLSPSDFNNAVPQFTNGDYASNPINPQYIAEPDAENYNRGTEPLQTLPAQWWNWFLNGFTKRFNKVNIYVKNIFNEITQLLSLVSVTPSGTEDSPTVGQLKDMFETKYPDYLKTTSALSNTYVPQTTKVNGHALSDNVTVTRSDLGLGTSATLDAGSAVGNVPVVGTALGTTNGNILMTDANGKLKPSDITTGTSAGNIPLIGTALGTTNNNIVVTDANGKLKSSGTVIGSAAGKTAGSAVGNVPLVGTALGTTNNNIVVTDTSGQLKPSGLTAPNLATYGLYVTAAATIASGIATYTITNLTGLTAVAGTTIKVTFSKALESSAAITEVRLSFGNLTNKTIKAARGNGTDTTGLAKVKSHLFTGGTYTPSKANKVWDAYTTLELMYTGSEWIVMGNPVLCSYFSNTQSYTVYANDLKVQWGDKSFSATSDARITVSLPISMNSYYASASFVTADYTFTGLQTVERNSSSVQFYGARFYASGSASEIIWYVIGY